LGINHTAGTVSYTVKAITGYALPTGVTAGTYNYTSATSSDTVSTLSFTTTAPVAGQRFEVEVASSATNIFDIVFVYRAPGVVGSGVGSLTIENSADTKNVLVAGSPSALVTVRDEFGSLVSGATVNWSVANRNPSLGGSLSRTATTSATGEATLTWTDSGAAVGATAATSTDVLSVAATAGNSGSFTTTGTSTYTYVATLTAGTVSVTTNAASTGVAANGSVTVTVTVTSAAGAALSGYPVTLSTDSKAFGVNSGAASVTKYNINLDSHLRWSYRNSNLHCNRFNSENHCSRCCYRHYGSR
jgi:hypothetical protein